jgi:hypothetical protein
MKKLTLLLLCSLFISCFTEPKKVENESVEKVTNTLSEQEKTVPVQKESTPLNLEILITLLNKDHNQLKEWATDNNYEIKSDLYSTEITYFGGNRLSIKKESTYITFGFNTPKCTGISIHSLNEESFKTFLNEAKNIFPDSDCNSQNDSYMKMMEDSGESFYCFTNGKVKVTCNDKSAVDKKFKIKEESYFSLNMENVNQ